MHLVADLSGLTLQSGPSRIVKDEYTPGGNNIVGGTLELDGELGTIQHHPAHIGMGGYPAMQIHQTGSGIYTITLIQ